MKRRELLGLGASLASGLVATAAGARELVSSELVLSDLQLSGDAAFGRALLLAPRELPAEPPLLVLLHGLGETHDQQVGARAYAERYGLLAAVSRLSRPPVERTLSGKDYFGPGRLEELNARLTGKPYRAPIIVCPYTPNPWKAGGAAVVERYASFIADRLKSEVEKRVGRSFPSTRVMVSGVSLGGYVALHVFLRRPEAFCGLGLVQAALARDQAARYAKELAEAAGRVGPRRVEILSSSFDPYRRPSELLHQHLQRREQASTLRVSPGPHDQSWLKESGVIETLLSADDVFSERAPRGAK